MQSTHGQTLIGTREFQNEFEEGSFVISYSKVEKMIETTGEPIYGVRLEKNKPDSKRSDEPFEAFLTADAEQIDKILNRLIMHSVLPCSALEVIDRLYDETLEEAR